jgi:hypothetical protein
MNLIKSAFGWLTGINQTGIGGNSDNLSDVYRAAMSRLGSPGVYTTQEVKDATARAAWSQAQVDLGRMFHENQRLAIKNLGELDKLTTETATLYSDTSVAISDRRTKAQEKLLTNEVRTQINDTRINSLKKHYAQGLNIHGGS